MIILSLSGVTDHARLACLDRHVNLSRKQMREAVKQGQVIMIPAKMGRMAFCHTVERIVVIADRNLSTVMTYSPGGYFFRLIERANEQIASGRAKRKELDRETFFILDDGTRVFMNKKETRIKRIFPPKHLRG